MSFKGIAWAGNVYEKFEAMCLEVEEAMYQDTVKYMENQVQKVGVSVKKFCSEVMDDLHPLSCVDPTSLDSDGSSLITPHGFTDVNKKPISSISLKKENKHQIMSDVTAEKGSSLSGSDVNLFSPQSPGIFIENKSSEKYAANKKFGVHRRPIGIKRISRNNHPSKESSRDTSASEDRRSEVANRAKSDSRLASETTDVASPSEINVRCESGDAVKGDALILHHSVESPASDETLSSESVRQDTCRVACDDMNGTSSSSRVMCESEAAMKGNTPFRDNLIESPPEKVSSAEPIRQIENVADCISPASDDLLDESTRLKGDPESTSSCSGSPTEATGSNIKSKVSNRERENKGVTLPIGGASTKDGSSSFSSPPCNTEPCNEDFIMSRDRFDMEFVENEEPRLEKFEISEMGRLGESCILVDGDELHCAPLQRTRKHKSYKKRIREALSLKKLKSRKDEDEKQEGESSSAHDSVESEDWELL